jgi:hypothetical protein
MDDERDKGDEEEAQGFAGNVLLPPDLRPELFEIPAQSAVGLLRPFREVVEALLEPGQDGLLRILRIEDLVQRTASAGFAAAQHGVGERLIALLSGGFLRRELGDDLGFQTVAGFGELALQSGGREPGLFPRNPPLEELDVERHRQGRQGDHGERHSPGVFQGSFPHALADGRSGLTVCGTDRFDDVPDVVADDDP